jgi:hypothetical protein
VIAVPLYKLCGVRGIGLFFSRTGSMPTLCHTLAPIRGGLAPDLSGYSSHFRPSLCFSLWLSSEWFECYSEWIGVPL